MTSIRFLLALAALVVTGAGMTAALLGKDRPVRRVLFLGLSALVGFGTVGLVSVVLMMIGVRIGPLVPIACAVVASAIYFACRPRFVEAPGSDRWRLLGGGAIAFAVALALLGALSTNSTGWDGDAFWTLKARSLARHGTFRNPDFTSDIRLHTHPRYPLLEPSVHAWIYSATGATAGRFIRLTMALLYVSSLAVVFSALRDKLPLGPSWGLTALYALTPAILSDNSGALDAYADYMLAVLFLIAAVEGNRWLETGYGAHARLSAFALACLPQLKDEGSMMVVLAALLLPLAAALRRGGRGFLQGAFLPAGGLGLFILWLIVRSVLPPDPHHAAAVPQVYRLPEVLRLFGSQLVRFKEWTLIWPVVGVILCLRSPKPRSPGALLAWLGAGLFAIYIVVWMMIPGADVKSAMRHNVNRLTLHAMPLFFVWAAWQLPSFSGTFPVPQPVPPLNAEAAP